MSHYLLVHFERRNELLIHRTSLAPVAGLGFPCVVQPSRILLKADSYWFSVISSLEPAQDRAKSSAKFMPSSSDEPLQKMAIASGEFTHMIPTTGNMMQMVDDTGRIQTVDLLEQPAPVVFNSANVKFLLYTRSSDMVFDCCAHTHIGGAGE
uniref:(California timema) hypothetical protein n=1 Tax=Timema californicum TaxID=61474 RepID=A0A7R9J698_TIMCA|nr:unnamed protein product [Timema californicum]